MKGVKHVLDLNEQYGRLYEFSNEMPRAQYHPWSLVCHHLNIDIDRYVEKNEMLARLVKDAQEEEYAVQCIQALSLSLK